LTSKTDLVLNKIKAKLYPNHLQTVEGNYSLLLWVDWRFANPNKGLRSKTREANALLLEWRYRYLL
jgi:hypothetical protein